MSNIIMILIWIFTTVTFYTLWGAKLQLSFVKGFIKGLEDGRSKPRKYMKNWPKWLRLPVVAVVITIAGLLIFLYLVICFIPFLNWIIYHLPAPKISEKKEQDKLNLRI